MTKPFARVFAVASVAALSATLLVGCAPIEDLVKQGVEDAISGATGAEIEADSKTVPEDFPATVPLIEGEVGSANRVAIANVKNWTVLLHPSGTPAEAFASAREQLEAGGFTAGVVSAEAEPGGTFTSDAYSVLLTTSARDGRTEITYIVTEITS